jgi:dihydrofolate synthase/folylpolyglutamate synthase
MVGDKDVETVMGMLPKDAVYYLTKPSSHRAKPVEELQDLALRIGLKLSGSDEGRPCVYGHVCEAYQKALADAADDDFIFVGGSSYLVADLLGTLEL